MMQLFFDRPENKQGKRDYNNGFFPWIVEKWPSVKSLPNNKVRDQSKLKVFADDKIIVTEKLKFVLERVENIVGKGENAGYQHFLLFSQGFQKDSPSSSFKVRIVW